MYRRGRPLVRASEARAVAVVVFAVALAVRGYWALRVQRPLDAVYSDMGGYVLRAQLLLAGELPAEPRMLALWPWGTHAIVAAEMALLGKKSHVAIGTCHAVVGAIAAPCASALTTRFVRSAAAALVAGLAVALWHPHVVYSGFFSSEIWFTSAILLGTVLLVRRAEGKSGALGAGVLLAVAFVVRPQILLTVALVVAALAAQRLRGKKLLRVSRGAGLALVAPLALAMAVSSVRFHRLTGRWGLIAAYEPVQRLFGETEVVKVESTWTAPNGDRWTWWFNPPTKKPVVPENTERFEGFVCDPDIIASIRKRRLAGVGGGPRVARMIDNVALLAVRNLPWPEDDSKVPFRRDLQKVFARVVLVVISLAVVGLAALRRHPFAALLVRIHLATIVIVGALYLGEARYRVPYDPFFIVAATVGAYTLVTGAFRALGAR